MNLDEILIELENDGLSTTAAMMWIFHLWYNKHKAIYDKLDAALTYVDWDMQAVTMIRPLPVSFFKTVRYSVPSVRRTPREAMIRFAKRLKRRVK